MTKTSMKIMSFVGGHEVNVIAGAEFDPAIRKYRGGSVVAVIPFSGRMLSAKAEQKLADPVVFDGVEIPTNTPQEWTSVDELPSTEECDLCIVSAMYVAACKALGRDTSRLLTMANTVVDEAGRVVGVTGFNRN